MGPIITAAELKALPRARLIDCRHRLSEPSWGRQVYGASHLPGAVHLHLDEDLSSPVRADGRGGRHPLPDPLVLGARLRALGLCQGDRVVAYDDVGGAFAARLWFVLRWLSHDNVAVLSGGLDAWTDAGGSLTAEAPQIDAPGDWQPHPDPAWITHREQALAGPLIDCRDGARYRGEHEPIDPVAGHIPGALSRPWRDSLDARGQLTVPPALPDAPVTFYCGSGVTACVGLLMATAAGRKGDRLYPGSWSDWLAAGGAVATG